MGVERDPHIADTQICSEIVWRGHWDICSIKYVDVLVENEHLDPLLTHLALHMVRLPASQRDPAFADKCNEAMATSLRILDHHLSFRQYIEGDRSGIAEYSTAPGIHRWRLLDLDRPVLAACRGLDISAQ